MSIIKPRATTDAIRIIRDAKEIMNSNLPQEHKRMAVQAWRKKADQYLREQQYS